MRGGLPWEARDHLKNQVVGKWVEGREKNWKERVNNRKRYERSSGFGRSSIF